MKLWIIIISMHFISCKVRPPSSLLNDPVPAENSMDTWLQQRPNFPMAVVPPAELQTGGEAFFAELNPVEGHENIFIDQKINLNLLGPGTALHVVYHPSSGHWAFAVSNGRSDGLVDDGSINKRTYPRIPYKEANFGKYPWPKDHNGQFFPGDRLVTSNRHHAQLMLLLSRRIEISYDEQTQVPSDTGFFAGHIGIQKDGGVFIGYTSGINAPQNQNPNNRTLEPHLREEFHNGLEKMAFGRNFDEMISAAKRPENNTGAHFPKEGSQFKGQMMIFSRLFLLYWYFNNSDERVNTYINQLTAAQKYILLKEPNLGYFFKRNPSLEKIKELTTKSLLPLVELVRRSEPKRFGVPTIKIDEDSIVNDLLIGNPWKNLRLFESVQGQVAYIQKCLELGIHPDTPLPPENVNNPTLLFWAYRASQPELVQKIVELGGNLNIQNKAGDTVLLLAIGRQRNQYVKLLLDAGADPTISSYDDDEIYGTHFGSNGLEEAIRLNNIEALSLLLEGNWNWERSDPTRPSYVKMAIQKGNPQIIHLLLDHKMPLDDVKANDLNKIGPELRQRIEDLKPILADENSVNKLDEELRSNPGGKLGRRIDPCIALGQSIKTQYSGYRPL